MPIVFSAVQPATSEKGVQTNHSFATLEKAGPGGGVYTDVSGVPRTYETHTNSPTDYSDDYPPVHQEILDEELRVARVQGGMVPEHTSQGPEWRWRWVNDWVWVQEHRRWEWKRWIWYRVYPGGNSTFAVTIFESLLGKELENLDNEFLNSLFNILLAQVRSRWQRRGKEVARRVRTSKSGESFC